MIADAIKPPAPPPTPAPTPAPTPEPEPTTPPAGTPDALAAQLAKAQRDFSALQKQLADQQAALTNSEKQRVDAENKRDQAERAQSLRAAIQSAGVRADGHDELAVILGAQVSRAEDGELVGPGNVPLAEYVKGYVDKRPAWLPPLPGSGAGAGPSARTGQKPVDLNEIKSGMTPEAKERVRQQILATLRSN